MSDTAALAQLERWMHGWREVWTQQRYDREHVASLFTEDAVYRPEMLLAIEPVLRGLDEIQAYLERWGSVVGGEDGTYEFGERWITGPAAAYEWWGVGELEGKPVTEAGCVVLVFGPDGRCTDFRDYHQVAEVREAPFPGFGRRLT